ncbi:hypothetical protein CSC82_28480 [Rhodobacteraceae bacterium 4F10]|nr:hypothetical protein CSC82_28480 [Rhodobacteraceae bacterium 4F10]
MAISFIIAVFFFINGKMESPFIQIAGYWQLIIGVLVTTVGWVIVTLLTQPTDAKTLEKFDNIIFESDNKFKNVGYKIVGFITGTIGVYSFLFATGNWIYGEIVLATTLSIITLICILILRKIWKFVS